MAKKRINKKVAIIGSLILAVILMGGVVFLLKYGKDPHKLISDAELALEQNDYELADEFFKEAYGAARDDTELKIDILFSLADLHAADNEYHEPDYQKVRGAWHQIINLDPRNLKALRASLQYYYEIGDFGGANVWKSVEENAEKIIEIRQERGLEPDKFVRNSIARAKLELAASGQTADREATLEEAVRLTEEALEIDPDNFDLYQYLARAALIEGAIRESKGIMDAQESAQSKAVEILEGAAEKLEDNPQAYVSLGLAKSRIEEYDQDMFVSELKSLTEKFPQSASVFSAISNVYRRSPDSLDDSIDMISKAMELEPDEIQYRLNAIDTYYNKFIISKDMSYLDKAVEMAEAGLEMPQAQETTSSRQYANQNNRLSLYSLLATCYIDKAIAFDEKGDQADRSKALDNAEDAVYQLQQMYGTGDNLYVQKWQGILKLAKGQNQQAINQMYKVYEQFNSAGRSDTQLSSKLAEAFEGRSEIGLRRQFIQDALSRGMGANRPELLLEYGELSVNLMSWAEGFSVAELYEKNFGRTDRSRNLLIEAHTGSGEYDKAQELIDSADGKSFELSLLEINLIRRKLNRARQGIRQTEGERSGQVSESYSQSEADNLQRQQLQLIEELIEDYPEKTPVGLVTYYAQAESEKGNIEKARNIFSDYFSFHREEPAVLILSARINDPGFPNIGQERSREIALSAISGIDDSFVREKSLGEYYSSSGDLEKSAEHYEKALEINPDDDTVIEALFDIAISQEQKSKAERIIADIRKDDVDSFMADLFEARLALVNEDYSGSIALLDRAIEKNPVNVYSYLLRSEAKNANGNDLEAVDDARTAVQMNPTNGTAVKLLARLLFERSTAMGESLSIEDRAETEQMIGRAIMLNPRDWTIQSMYAEFIKNREPDKALAIRQELSKNYPNVGNYVMLGSLAANLAVKEFDKTRKAGLFEIAEDSFLKAYELDPENEQVATQYAELLRLSGQKEKAESFFSSQKSTLWKLYLNSGEFDKAISVLEELRKDNPDDEVLLRGLAAASKGYGDIEGVKKYADMIVEKNRNVDNEIFRLQYYLDSGLIEESGPLVASFRERYPDEKRGLLLEALYNIRNGELEKGLSLTNRYLEMDPENAMAWKFRGKVHNLLGQTSQAISALEKSNAIMPDPETQIELARVFIGAGRENEAIGQLRDAIESERAPRSAKMMLESLYKNSNRKTDLIGFYSEMIDSNPDQPLWYIRAGSFYLNDKRYTEAETLLKRGWDISKQNGTDGNMMAYDLYLEALQQAGKINELIEVASGYTDSSLSVASYVHLAQVKVASGSRTTGLEYYHRSLEKAGTNEQFIFNILMDMRESVGASEVERWCRGKLSSDADSKVANFVMFQLALLEDEHNRAVDYMDKLISISEEGSAQWVDYVNKKAQALLGAYDKTSNQEYFDSAISEFERILVKYPDNVSVLNNVAYLLAKKDLDIERAMDYAKKAYEQNPNNPNLMDTYALVLYRKKDFDKSQELLQRAIQVIETQGQQANAPFDMYKHFGMTLEAKGENEAALSAYKTALELVSGSEYMKQTETEEIKSAIERLSR